MPIDEFKLLSNRSPNDRTAIEEVLVELHRVKREKAALQDKFDHLQQIYNKLADQWNVYQATAKPDNRNLHRAEGAGELARKLAEVFLGLAYDTDARALIFQLLEKLREGQDPAAGQEVEVRPERRLNAPPGLTRTHD